MKLSELNLAALELAEAANWIFTGEENFFCCDNFICCDEQFDINDYKIEG